MRVSPLLLALLGCSAKDGQDSGRCDAPVSVFRDLDEDGVGGEAVEVCAPRDWYAAVGGDCDDRDADRSPNLSENRYRCDGVDNDCDSAVDEGQGDIWFPDADGDGQGDPESSQLSCAQPEGWVADASDCDDSDPSVGLGFEELCDGVDNRCDGRVDLSASPRGFLDLDGDGYGDTETWDVCAEVVAQDGDCDDADPTRSPGAPETCDDGVDNDCDGLLDCEDGGCMGDPWCVERDCEDGDDEDFDGLVDCLDEDCWTANCGALEVGVLGGGAMRVRLEAQDRQDNRRWHTSSAGGARLSSGSDNWSASETQMQVRVEDIEGFARWRVASGTASCAWTVAALRWSESASARARTGRRAGRSWSTQSSASSSYAMTRQGFALSSACPFSVSSGQLLPPALARPVHSNRVRPLRSSGGGAWYVPASTWQVSTANGGTFVAGVSDYNYFFAIDTSYVSNMGWGTTSSAGAYYWEWYSRGSDYAWMRLDVPEIEAGDVRTREWRP
ncbi:MAG: putative metal-binding motif-containing protein [Alphaproteobacteria bacterium]|nr:putative metal-binding motif-containing protein [Alphaproteobacteria bacterium]